MEVNFQNQPPATPASRSGGGVQSVERTFELLELLADAGGEVALSQLAESSGLPLPTIHRIMRTLLAGGYVRQQPSRRYSLGPKLIRLGETAGRSLGAWARPYLAAITDAVGETSNMAILDGAKVVYVSQVPSPHAMRMFTEVGRQVDVHCTAVGKAMLAEWPVEQVDQLLSRAGMPAKTERTITDLGTFRTELATVRDQGYAVDDGEQELGVHCIAVAVPKSSAAISISGPQTRMSLISLDRVVPMLQDAAAKLAGELANS